MAEFTAEFKLVGSLTRSTVGQEPVDPRAQAIGDALHWIWSFRTTVERLWLSIGEELVAFGSPQRLTQRRSSSRVSLDEHCLVVAGGNLLKAIDRVRDHVPIADMSSDVKRQIKLFRNIYEHWEEQRATYEQGTPKISSGKLLAAEFPTGMPWSIEYLGADRDIRLGGIVSVAEVERFCDVAEHDLLAAE